MAAVSGDDPIGSWMRGSRAVGLIFVAVDCPIANAYMPEIARIRARFAPLRVPLLAVYCDPDTTIEQIRRHAAQFRHGCPTVRDPDASLARKVSATVTPEAAVLAPDGRVLYRGRIDDRFVTFGQRRASPSRRDLIAALEAIIAGRIPPVRVTTAIGCFIPGASGVSPKPSTPPAQRKQLP